LKQLNRLQETGTSVWIIKGNHDAASKISRELPWPKHVHVFSHENPETRYLESLAVAIHGWSYPRRDIYENIARRFPDAHRDYFNIGLLHTALTGRRDHEPYAPCKLADLSVKGYEYWALSHVHTRDVMETETGKVVFPGNLQGRHIREQGPKGAYLITVTSPNDIQLEFHPLHTVEWTQTTIDITGRKTPEDIASAATSVLISEKEKSLAPILVARVIFTGQSELKFNLDQDHLFLEKTIRTFLEPDMNDVYIEKILFDITSPLDASRLLRSAGPVADLFRNIRERMTGDADLRDLLDQLNPLYQKLPIDFHRSADTIRLQDRESIRAFLSEIESLLLSHSARMELDSWRYYDSF